MTQATTIPVDYKSLYEAAQLQVMQLTLRVAQLEKMIFGSRHERFVPDDAAVAQQLALGLQAEAIGERTITKEEVTITRTNIQVEKKPHPGRMALPADLPREVVTVEPEGDTTNLKKIGEEITEQLDVTPSKFFVRRFVRNKYARPDGQGVIIGKLPSQPIDKCIAGPGLLAQVIIDKYADHLPLYRQEQRFSRVGITLAPSTLCNWKSGVCRLITPLYDAMVKEVLQTSYLHVDETTIKVLDQDKKGTTHRGYFWVYHNSHKKIVIFDYRKGRDREGPSEILKAFKGHLQVDGYQVYEDFGSRECIILLHCMAHARRKFSEALNNDKVRSEYVLKYMQQLYALEEHARNSKMNFDEIYQLRQQQAVPILEHLGKWMKEAYTQVTPRSSIGKALAYSIERWEGLCCYTTNGMLHIDNNPVENSIRPIAIGRKNYLFAGSHEAAQESAMIYSLLGTCKMHNINPWEWLKDVLTRLPDHPINQIKELLPHNWKPLN
ncbi:MAG: IS66 family transposase [Bacteroidota bacterium]|nr:IS66 family transposase [Bacteroidota bacterium]